MSTSNLESLTLREKLTEAERLTRELSQHLEQGFIPKVHTLRRVTRTAEGTIEDSTDATVRNTAASVMESHEFTSQLANKLTAYVQSIQSEVGRIMKGH